MPKEEQLKASIVVAPSQPPSEGGCLAGRGVPLTHL